MAVINGTSRGDSLTGSSEDDLIRGYGGFDTILPGERVRALDLRTERLRRGGS